MLLDGFDLRKYHSDSLLKMVRLRYVKELSTFSSYSRCAGQILYEAPKKLHLKHHEVAVEELRMLALIEWENSELLGQVLRDYSGLDLN